MKNLMLHKKKILLYTLLTICCLFSLLFVYNDYNFYKETIVKVTTVQIVKKEKITDYYKNNDILYTQVLTGKILNGALKGKTVELKNQYSYSGAADNQYKAGDKLFVSLDNTSINANKNDSSASAISGTINGLKRDTYLVFMAVLFTVFIIAVGKKKGLFSLFSLIFNIVLFSLVMDLYLKGINLLLVCSIVVIVFTVFSLILVGGYNQKTFTAVISTLLGTFLTLIIAYIVMKVTNEKGVRYEEMQFLTHPPHEIFMAEILVGCLGAVMDVCITISSSIYELCETNPSLSSKALMDSGREIGKDIMGTMTNVLFFAYVSGGIPMLLIYLKNGFQTGYSFYMNLSLELIRALTGSIGIVLAIPLSLFTTVFVQQKFKKRSGLTR
ncbi:YibE/F family protein [Anaerocolumna chitinilytica]|uniref:Membrane protein n=1 Tax=Anaerocolumna chitinilytica TaxID=1727145 RepID=A0A7I8DK66_9FIRM|nr:YibE/F family protein [Anaerocolumna chitinilytica]BCJ98740.1 membrane protein [Anaerocolumna chitinilytica]